MLIASKQCNMNYEQTEVYETCWSILSKWGADNGDISTWYCIHFILSLFVIG